MRNIPPYLEHWITRAEETFRLLEKSDAELTERMTTVENDVKHLAGEKDATRQDVSRLYEKSGDARGDIKSIMALQKVLLSIALSATGLLVFVLYKVFEIGQHLK